MILHVKVLIVLVAVGIVSAAADTNDSQLRAGRELQTTLTTNVASSAFDVASTGSQQFTWVNDVDPHYGQLDCTAISGTIEVYRKAGSFATPGTDTPTNTFTSCGVDNTPTTVGSTGNTIYITVYATSGSSITGAVLTVSGSVFPTPAPTIATPSPTASPTAAPTASACFSESATVNVLEEEEPVAMKELQVGQKVFAGFGEDNQPFYETVYGFAHRDVDKVNEYLRITTAASAASASSASTNSGTLEISSDHLIFVQGQKDPVPAGSLQVGDVLMHQSIDQKENKPTKITDIQTIHKRGLYAPLTKDGTVIVDGIHASSYVSIRHLVPRVISTVMQFTSEQTFFHWWMAPYRIFCIHVAPQMCMDDYSEGEGYIHWLVVGKNLAETAQGCPSLLMVAGLSVVLGFCGFFMLLESLMEKPFFWFVQGFCGCLLWCRLAMKKKKEYDMKKKKEA